MTSENNAPEIRISNWARATGTPSGLGAVRKVVVVSDLSDEQAVHAGLAAEDCEVVVVASPANAYSQIKRIAPNLVVVCLDIDEPEGFHVRSMLKMDSATAQIPVLTPITTRQGRSAGGDAALPSASVATS